jgi:hypothetical protein
LAEDHPTDQQTDREDPLTLPLLTLRESPRIVLSPQFAKQLAADGATGLSTNQVGEDDAIRDVVDVADIDIADDSEDGFRQFGSSGVCRHNFHCQGSERCVKRNGEFM